MHSHANVLSGICAAIVFSFLIAGCKDDKSKLAQGYAEADTANLTFSGHLPQSLSDVSEGEFCFKIKRSAPGEALDSSENSEVCHEIAIENLRFDLNLWQDDAAYTGEEARVLIFSPSLKLELNGEEIELKGKFAEPGEIASDKKVFEPGELPENSSLSFSHTR